MPFDRRSGLLLHPTSLPGKYGIGTLGQDVFNWLNFLEAAGQRLWQVMPLGPTGYGDSPYQCFSAFAGNPYLINLEQLVHDNLLSESDLANAPSFPEDKVDYGPVISFKLDMLNKAFQHFSTSATTEQRDRFNVFTQSKASWLEDFALFMACKEAHGGQSWNHWDADIRARKPKALSQWRSKLTDEISKQKFWQWLFFEQWTKVKNYANSKDIKIIGDIPIFIAYDSADAWSNPDLFYFDEGGNPTVIAGVPPDYFSATGQRWGNPLYRWDVMAKQNYAWWIERFKGTLELVDIVRVDHFRGFEAYWEIPAAEETAIKGAWVKAPGADLFKTVREVLGELPIIAEDLGVITPEVEKLRDDAGFPGMKVLQFAFAGDAADPYLPHNYPRNSVVYSGTHDNDTTKGWYAGTTEKERDFVRKYLARNDDNITWDFIRLAFASVADTAVAPLQDVLGLGSEGRMNTPGLASGNWNWRFTWEQLPYWIAPQLKEMAELYRRLASGGAVDTPYRQSTIE
ncbi:MAG: 4-alpha-glucanotransferase [Trueperaceae bacterium]